MTPRSRSIRNPKSEISTPASGPLCPGCTLPPLPIVTCKEAAAALRISRNTFYRWRLRAGHRNAKHRILPRRQVCDLCPCGGNRCTIEHH